MRGMIDNFAPLRQQGQGSPHLILGAAAGGVIANSQRAHQTDWAALCLPAEPGQNVFTAVRPKGVTTPPPAPEAAAVSAEVQARRDRKNATYHRTQAIKKAMRVNTDQRDHGNEASRDRTSAIAGHSRVNWRVA